MYFRRHSKITGKVISILILILPVLLLYNEEVYADACKDCHTNPKYRKEDVTRLKECLTCHGSAGHPYKQITGTVEAAEISASQKAAASGQSRTPDIKDMVLIPEGEFVMGTDDRLKDEKPEHVVYLNAFFIDRFEVTNEGYRKFVDATGHKAPDSWKNNNYPSGKGKHPVIFVDWNDADAYCEWAGKKLPTEEKWEKAARGPKGNQYPWGNEYDENKTNLTKGTTMPVGSYETDKSYYGVYDMGGNVMEWIDAWYEPYPGSKTENKDFGKQYRILRGGTGSVSGHYTMGKIFARSSFRHYYLPGGAGDDGGIRCAKSFENK